MDYNKNSNRQPIVLPADTPPSAAWLQTVPASTLPYILLMRLDRPIGYWLLLFPCWWGLALGNSLDINQYLLFMAGAIVMRGAGCTLNDIIDRELDALVERTRSRPLPSGMVTLPQAIGFLILQSLVGLAIAITLGFWVVILSLAIGVVVLAYPFMKRITWWPQLFLGIAFNWGAILGFVVAQQRVSLSAILLYIGGIFWTIGYDTIYAHQDREDDQKAGIRSTALLWGDKSRWEIGLCYSLATVFLLLAALTKELGYAPLAAMVVVALHFCWQVLGLKMNDGNDCLMRFRSNRTIGWLVLVGLLAGW